MTENLPAPAEEVLAPQMRITVAADMPDAPEQASGAASAAVAPVITTPPPSTGDPTSRRALERTVAAGSGRPTPGR